MAQRRWLILGLVGVLVAGVVFTVYQVQDLSGQLDAYMADAADPEEPEEPISPGGWTVLSTAILGVAGGGEVIVDYRHPNGETGTWHRQARPEVLGRYFACLAEAEVGGPLPLCMRDAEHDPLWNAPLWDSSP